MSDDHNNQGTESQHQNNMQKPLSNNLNALGELVERYGYEPITRYLSEIVLNWHVDPQSEDAKIWRDLNAKMTAAVDAYPTRTNRRPHDL